MKELSEEAQDCLGNDTSHDGRLSRIETLWSVVQRAHNSNQQVASSAQRDLLNRYGSAIRRYLGASLKNPEVANDLYQEFAVKFIQGDFKNADPAKGKFRSFVKTVLFRMVALHFRKLGTSKTNQVNDFPEVAQADEYRVENEKRFLKVWRNELLERTWESLEASEENGNSKSFSILKVRIENPAADFTELSKKLTTLLDKEVSVGNARVLVHRARSKFAKEMIGKISETLEIATKGAIEEELIDLRLIDYCRDELNEMHSDKKQN